VAADEIKETTGVEPGAAEEDAQAVEEAQDEDAAPVGEPVEKAAGPRRAGKADSSVAARARKKAAGQAAEAAAAEPAAGKTAKPAAKRSAAKKPVAKKPAAEKPVAEKPAAEKVAGKAAKPAAKKPAAKKPAAERPAAEKPAAEKPTVKPRARAAKTAQKEASAKGAKAAAERAKGVAPAPKERPPKQVKAPKPPRPVRPKPGPLQGTVVDLDGHSIEMVALAAERFGVAAELNTLHLVVRAEQAARRRGTASTKSRGEIAGTTAKMYRQKGTGRARAGSVKSPIRTGGGTAFGPKPRDFAIKVNRKVVRKALAMALSTRADAGRVFVTRGLALEAPSTRTVHRLLVAMDIDAPVLVITHDEPAVARSVRNLAYAETAEVGALTTETVLRARSLVFTERAFGALDQA
jgi:large subunit ribosomal protein L4